MTALMLRGIGDLGEYIGTLERFLRLERLETASELFKARTVYVTAIAFVVMQIFNGIQMFVVYNGFVMDHAVLVVALLTITATSVALRWQANFDFYSVLWGSLTLIGIGVSAVPDNVGINSALAPNLVSVAVIVALLGSNRSLLIYCVSSLLLVVLLHINAASADPAVLSDPAYVALRNSQRSVQMGIAIVLLGAVMALLTLSMKTLFGSLERSVAEARASATAKMQFLADMSHELRTPLNGVLGMNQLLLRTDLDDMQQNYARIVEECGSGMIAVIDDVLDLSRLDSGRVELKPTSFNPAKMLESLSALHQANASAKDVALHVNVEPGLPDLFFGDHGRLRQIVSNLVSNAVKFTDAGFVALSLRGQPLEDGRWWLNIFVQDSGIGITPKRCAQIFERFEQAEDGQTNTVRGSGLGLAISKQLTRLFDGEISVTSEPGKGSLFCVAVPLEAIVNRAEPDIAAPVDLHAQPDAVNDQQPDWTMAARAAG